MVLSTFTLLHSHRHHGGGLVAKLCQTLATAWTLARQALLSMGFSRQEYWSGLPFPPPGGLPNLGIEPGSPALQADSLPTELQGKIPITSSSCQTETVSPLNTSSPSLTPLPYPSPPPSYFLSLWIWVLLGPHAWNHTVFVLLWLACFTEQSVCKVHLCCGMSWVPSFLKLINIPGVLTWQD